MFRACDFFFKAWEQCLLDEIVWVFVRTYGASAFDPRGPQVTERVRSPPLANESSDLVAATYQSAGIVK